MELIFKENLNSTNTYAMEHMTELSDMTFVYCNSQTEGKGRLNRVWFSENTNNLYLTIVLKPERKDFPFINLTQYLSVILCRVLLSYDVEAQIKWPNDVLVDGKKIAGILAKSVVSGNTFKGVALGIGVNLNLSKEEITLIDKPATSLNLIINKDINRDEFLNKLIEEFTKSYDDFAKAGFNYIEDEYLSKACFLNKEITVNVGNNVFIGTAKTLNSDGALILCDNKKQEDVVITMGEIQ